MTIIPIVICAFGTVTKGLLKGLEDLEVCGRVETIQTTALLRTARILRSVLVTWGDLLSLRLQWKTIGSNVKSSNEWIIIIITRRRRRRPSAKTYVKNTQGVNNNNGNNNDNNVNADKKMKAQTRTESVQIAAQSNAIRTNNMKAWTEKMQQNSDIDYAMIETKRSATYLANARKEYKTWYGCVGQMITENCARSLNLTIRTIVICET